MYDFLLHIINEMHLYIDTKLFWQTSKASTELKKIYNYYMMYMSEYSVIVYIRICLRLSMFKKFVSRIESIDNAKTI